MRERTAFNTKHNPRGDTNTMMGKTHAATGMLAGLLLGNLTAGLDTVAELLPFALVTAGYALVPDLDHPSSTATRKFGLVTGLVSLALRSLSRLAFELTKTDKDGTSGGVHRHLTHTAVFAVVLGALAAGTTALGHAWVVAAWLALGLVLAVDRLGRIGKAVVAGLVLGWILDLATSGYPHVITAANASLDQSAGWLGLAVGIGCFVHCLGDAMTCSGCPILWPLKINGERWYDLRLPRFLRLTTDSWVETGIIYPATLVACLFAIPGAAANLYDMATLVVTLTGPSI